MTTIKKKRNLLIHLLTATICICIVAVTGLTKKPVLTVCAAEGETNTVPTADYSFAITNDGTAFSAICNELTVTSNASITDLIASIDTVAGTGKIKKLIFDGGIDSESGDKLPLDIGNMSCSLSKGTYILNGMITGSSVNGVIRLESIACDSIYIESAEIFAKSTGRAIYNDSNGSINIISGKVEGTSSYAIYNASRGEINITGGTVIAKADRAILNFSVGVITISQASGATTLITAATTSANYGTIYNAYGVVKVLSGTIVNSSSGSAVYNYASGKVEISDGIIENTSSGYGVFNMSTGTVNVSGGNILADTNRALYNYGGGTVNFSGGEAFSRTAYAISNTSGTTTVSGGKVSTTSSRAIDNTTGVVNITGGEVYATSGYGIYNSSGAINISGGEVYATAANGTAIYNSTTGVITINGTALVTSKNTNATRGTVHLYNAGGQLIYLEGSITNTANGNLIYNPNGATVTIIPKITELDDVDIMVSIKLSYEKVAEDDYNILSGSGIRFGATFNTTMYDKAGVLVIPTRLLGSNADIKEYFSNNGTYDAIDNPTSKLININAENKVLDTTLFFAGVIYNYPETRFGEELAAVCYYQYGNVMYFSKQIVTSFVDEAQWYLDNISDLTDDQVAVLQIIAAK